ncbi:molybdate ABC transporter substrate-binding protein [Microlunatus speluncae]|uniref:molybdate ABC transporter substrate-binding protein n=1 Tax=Microlunatus speluncae TaxID=2594267 RepID=UPI00126648C3|nr:molybdate ABC transporter substrate-binding protein [Microlunatus speluncae]
MIGSIRPTLVSLLLILFVAGCSGAPTGPGNAVGPDSSGAPGSSGAPSGPGVVPTGEITVLAAASLTESFTAIGHDFEAANPGTKITFSFGSSATLAAQVTAGAPVDVFAAANESTMKIVSDAGQAVAPQPFVTNTLEIAVPPGNSAKITGLADFADEALRIALCAPEVPCGSAAEKVFQTAGIDAKPDTLEADVKTALQKVRLGEVDAALVYRTDVIAAGDAVQGIQFPEAGSAVNVYPITALTEAKNPDLAAAFVDYVHGPAGQTVLTKAGFASPS